MCCNPEIIISAFGHFSNGVTWQGCRIIFIMKELFEPIAVKSIQSVVRCNPYKATGVLGNIIYRVIGEPVFLSKMLEMQLRERLGKCFAMSTKEGKTKNPIFEKSSQITS